MELDASRVVEAETNLGPLLVEKDAEIVTRSLLDTGGWDPSIAGLVRKALGPGATFVDAGANIGYFTVLASRVVGAEGRVFAIEPDPLNVAILKANLERHDCSNVTVLPVAAWSERADLNLMRLPHEGAATQVGGEASTGATVTGAPLDELVSGRVDYLKVDTEFTDHIVVASAAGLIGRNPAMLITVEFHPTDATHTGDSPSEVLRTYQDLGLRPYKISERGDGVIPAGYDEIADGSFAGERRGCFDFALSRELPAPLIFRKPLLERAGDMLEHVPKRIRPKIRRRDRQPAAGS